MTDLMAALAASTEAAREYFPVDDAEGIDDVLNADALWGEPAIDTTGLHGDRRTRLARSRESKESSP